MAACKETFPPPFPLTSLLTLSVICHWLCIGRFRGGRCIYVHTPYLADCFSLHLRPFEYLPPPLQCLVHWFKVPTSKKHTSKLVSSKRSYDIYIWIILYYVVLDFIGNWKYILCSVYLNYFLYKMNIRFQLYCICIFYHLSCQCLMHKVWSDGLPKTK